MSIISTCFRLNENIFMLSSGDVLEMDEHDAKVVDKVHTGEVLVDGNEAVAVV